MRRGVSCRTPMALVLLGLLSIANFVPLVEAGVHTQNFGTTMYHDYPKWDAVKKAGVGVGFGTMFLLIIFALIVMVVD